MGTSGEVIHSDNDTHFHNQGPMAKIVSDPRSPPDCGTRQAMVVPALLFLACQLDEDLVWADRKRTVNDPKPEDERGVIVLAGGGSEGEIGDENAWSSALYATLLRGGDRTLDGLTTVAILSTAEETEWLPQYFVWLGADSATNVRVSSREQAEAAAEVVAASDAVFIKGGDQGEYYDLWNNTALETAIIAVSAAGGGVGGTSAGAMALAEYTFAGGEDLISADVLADAQTPYLDDASTGGSGVHDDFLALVPAVVVDTHFTQRARLGRLAGILARVADESAPPGLLGIGIEERTGIVVLNDGASVLGDGSVTFLLPDADHEPIRERGQPLVWANIKLDRLTHGWEYDLAARAVNVDWPPDGTDLTTYIGTASPPDANWKVDGNVAEHEERFDTVVKRAPQSYGTYSGFDNPVLSTAVGILDAHNPDRRAANEEGVFRALYDYPGFMGFLVGESSSIRPSAAHADRLSFVDNPNDVAAPMSVIVLDTAEITHRSLSPSVSLSDVGDGSLHAAAQVGVRLHLLYSGVGEQLEYNVVTRQVEAPQPE